MKKTGKFWQRVLILASIAGVFLVPTLVQSQSHPNLFRQRPTPTQPGRHATAAQIGDLDENLLSISPERMAIALPGKPDLLVNREHHQRRGPRRLVWRGRVQNDPGSKVTLTLHDGVLVGRIDSGNDVFTIRPGTNGRVVIEKLDPHSFSPEWGLDLATHGR
jgi:hypothetical protein